MKFIKKQVLFLFIALFLTNFQISATEKTIVLGGNSNWLEVTSSTENLDFTEGYLGYDGYKIASGTHKINENTDLYLSFEDESVLDLAGNYKIIENRIYKTENAAVGRRAAVSRENETMLSLMGEKNSIFGKFGPTGSFSIEFYLRPSVCITGENIFFWRSSRNIKQYSDYQTIEASFLNGKMKWKFLNVFSDVDQNSYDLYLTSRSTILPEKWSHHYICYDEDEGMIEYYIDGHLEDLIYTTDSGNAYGQFLIPDLGSPAQIEIAKNFIGSLDEFVISREVKHYLDSHNADEKTPYFLSVPLKTSKNGCFVTSLNAECSVPEQTELQFFVRGSENSFDFNEFHSNQNEWVEVIDGKPVSSVFGRYFQVLVYFYSDGSKKLSPILTEISLNYEEPEFPISPSKVFTDCKDDGSILVSWSNNNFDGKYGYLLYYGTKSGEFIGVGLDQGSSPIDCGKETSCLLTGLKSGQIYYFAVACYLLDYPEIIGNSSKEVFARPLIHK